MLKLIAVGDISLGDQPVRYGHGVRSIIEKYGIDFIFEHVRNQLNGQIVFGNLEYVLSDINFDASVLTSGEFRGRPEYVKGLHDAGFTTLSLANNHSMQYDVDVFNDTLNHLKNAGITPIGISVNRFSNSHSIYVHNTKFEIIAFSLRPENYFTGEPLYAHSIDYSNILHQVESIKKCGAIVIVSLHWGEEYLHIPSPRQIAFARNIIDAGASLIIGHHPHVLQGIEKYKNGYIIYSLGNFVADFWQSHAKHSAILKCEVSGNGVECIETIPIYINELYQPTIAQDKMKDIIHKKIEEYSIAINNVTPSNANTADDEYNKIANKIYRRYRIESYLYFVRNLYRYKLSIIFQSVFRFLGRRFHD